MKKKFNIFLAVMLGFVAIATTSCESDEEVNPVFNKPTQFVLNTPKYVAGLYDLANTETIQLTCSQPDYGYAAATTYAVEVSLDQAFAEGQFTTLASTFATPLMNVNANELAVALCSLYGVIDETSVPENPIKVYLRAVATLANVGDESRIVSNVIELPNVQLYYALPDVEMPANMYMIGDFCDWSWSNAAKMVVENGKDNMWWCIAYVGPEKGFKFNYAKAWDGNEIGFAGITENNTAAAGKLVDANGNISVEKPGWYIFALTVNIVGRDYEFVLDVFEPKIYIFGATNGGNWGADDAWSFSIPTEANGVFVSPALAADGEVRLCIKPSWGGDWWAHEFTVKNDGTIYYRENDNIADNWEMDKGAEYSLQGKAGQVITLDFSTGKGKIE